MQTRCRAGWALSILISLCLNIRVLEHVGKPVEVIANATGKNIKDITFLKFYQGLLPIKCSQGPIESVEARGVVPAWEGDALRRQRDIPNVGDGRGDLYTREAPVLLVLLHADATAVALQKIGGHGLPWRNFDIRRQHHQIIGGTPALADNLVALHNSSLCGRAQKHERAGNQRKATARQRAFPRLPLQHPPDIGPHLLTPFAFAYTLTAGLAN